jgi:hypothetical protein
MIEFALSSNEWKLRERSTHHLTDLWLDLLGMNALHRNMWSEQKKDLITPMAPLFERWAREYLASPDCTLAFLRFLNEPAAQALLLDGLVWVDGIRSQLGKGFWSDTSNQRVLAALLDYIRRTYYAELRAHTVAFAAFRRLLLELASHQNAWAVELLNTLVF